MDYIFVEMKVYCTYDSDLSVICAQSELYLETCIFKFTDKCDGKD